MKLIDYQEQWKQLVDRALTYGLETLSCDEKVWFTVQSLIQDIHNGGLISFYYNSGADLLNDTFLALRALDAQKVIELMSRVNELFPSGVPKDITTRNEIINSWPDDGTIDEILEPIENEVQQEAELLESKLVSFIQDHHLAG
jgi:hypothetical protein